MKFILNTYIKRPLIFDIIIIGLVGASYAIVHDKFSFDINISQENFKATISDLINTSISLAGFVLASLTIIVTFKDNLAQKKQDLINPTKEDLQRLDKTEIVNESGMSLLFSSKHYGRIVGVFTWAVFIFLGLFFTLSILKVFTAKIPTQYYIYLSIAPIILTTLTIFRSVLVLYKIIQLQLLNNK